MRKVYVNGKKKKKATGVCSHAVGIWLRCSRETKKQTLNCAAKATIPLFVLVMLQPNETCSHCSTSMTSMTARFRIPSKAVQGATSISVLCSELRGKNQPNVWKGQMPFTSSLLSHDKYLTQPSYFPPSSALWPRKPAVGAACSLSIAQHFLPSAVHLQKEPKHSERAPLCYGKNLSKKSWRKIWLMLQYAMH